MAARYLAISKSQHNFNPRRRRTISAPIVTGPVTLSALLVVLVAVLSVVYIIQANAISTTGYDIRAQQQQIDELQRKQQALAVQVSDAQSLKVLEQHRSELNMVNFNDISYLKASESLARR